MSTIRERAAAWQKLSISHLAVGAEPDRRTLLAALDALVEAAGEVDDQVSKRYDDQWAVGSVYLVDLDDLRAAIAAAKEASDG